MPLDSKINTARPAATAEPEIDLRLDLKLIADMITPGSRVLDVGCGDGALLAYLAQKKN